MYQFFKVDPLLTVLNKVLAIEIGSRGYINERERKEHYRDV